MKNAASPQKVLLVEDDQDDYFLIAQMFMETSGHRFELSWAQTFEEASHLTRENFHDVYLFDLALIGGSGTELLREMKERGNDKPVILLTGALNPDIDARAIELGASDYLVKGDFSAFTLIRAIRYALERKQIEADLRRSFERVALIVVAQQDIASAGLDLAKVMNVMCERSQKLLHGTGAAVEFVEGDELVYTAATGSAASQMGLRVKSTGSLSGLCARNGEGYKCDDADSDTRVDQAACRQANIKSMIVVPLKTGQTTSGVLKVLSDRGGAFSHGDMLMLQMLAAFASSAFNQAAEFEIRANLIDQLRDAVTNVKTLGGLLPICANCKKIRDDKGYWNQIELFIRDHSGAKFSHGICPECSEKFYPDLHKAAKDKSKPET